jgi:hypothetical protein
MKPCLCALRAFLALIALLVISAPGAPARGADQGASAIVDRAIEALGGQAKLSQIRAIVWKARGKTFDDGSTSAFTNETTVQDLAHFRMEWEDEVDGNLVRGVTVIDGDKGWRKYAGEIRDLDANRLANHKRNIYLLVVPVLLVPLKSGAFLLERAGEEDVDGKPAAGVKVVGPDGKEFFLYCDKETGLPVKLAARIGGGPGQEFLQESIFRDYRDFDGIKKATRHERRRDGAKILEQEIFDFRVLDQVAPGTFGEPS